MPTTRTLDAEDISVLPLVDIETLKGGSTAFVIEAAVGMRLGKMRPVGYDNVATFFRTEHGRTTPAHNVWLVAEAELARKLPDMEKDFPDAERLATYIFDHLKQDHPALLATIKQRLSEENWSMDAAAKTQESAGEVFQRLFPKVIEG